jgi:hypothetical protein
MGLRQNDCDDGRRMVQGRIQWTTLILLLLGLPLLLLELLISNQQEQYLTYTNKRSPIHFMIIKLRNLLVESYVIHIIATFPSLATTKGALSLPCLNFVVNPPANLSNPPNDGTFTRIVTNVCQAICQPYQHATVTITTRSRTHEHCHTGACERIDKEAHDATHDEYTSRLVKMKVLPLF